MIRYLFKRISNHRIYSDDWIFGIRLNRITESPNHWITDYIWSTEYSNIRSNRITNHQITESSNIFKWPNIAIFGLIEYWITKSANTQTDLVNRIFKIFGYRIYSVTEYLKRFDDSVFGLQIPNLIKYRILGDSVTLVSYPHMTCNVTATWLIQVYAYK